MKQQEIKKPLSVLLSEKLAYLKTQDPDIIDLTIGAPDHQPIITEEAVRTAFLERTNFSYSSSKGTKELRRAVANFVGQLHRNAISEEQVIITPGVKIGLFYVFQTLLSAGDEVLIPAPCWLSYGTLIKKSGGVAKYLNADSRTDWMCPIDLILQNVHAKTKMVMICNPVNPTGLFWQKEALIKLYQALKEKGVYLVLDAIYEDFDFFNKKIYLSELSTSGKFEYLIYLNGFSKNIAVPGFRLGYIVTNEAIIERLATEQANLMTCPPVFAQSIVATVLNTIQPNFFENILNFYKQKLELVKADLYTANINFISPTGAFYVMMDISWMGVNSIDAASILLERCKIGVVPGIAYGDTLDNFVRLALTQESNKLKLAISRISKLKADKT